MKRNSWLLDSCLCSLCDLLPRAERKQSSFVHPTLLYAKQGSLLEGRSVKCMWFINLKGLPTVFLFRCWTKVSRTLIVWPSVFTEKNGSFLCVHCAHCRWISCVPFTGSTGLFTLSCKVNQSDWKFLGPPILPDLHQIGLFSVNLATKFCWNPYLCNSTHIHTHFNQLARQPDSLW